MKPPKTIPYLTRVGAAKLCGVHESYIRQAVNDGKLRVGAVTQCGCYSLLLPADVKRWNAQRNK